MGFLKNLEAVLIGAILSLGIAKADFPVQVVCNAQKTQEQARCSGNKIVWKDYRNGNDDFDSPVSDVSSIFGKDMETGIESEISSSSFKSNYSPDIDGNEVMWARCNGYLNSGFSIKEWDGVRENLQISPPISPFNSGPKMSGKRFTWLEVEGYDPFAPTFLNVYDRDAKQIIFSKQLNSSNLNDPAIFGDFVSFPGVESGYYTLELLNLNEGKTTIIDNVWMPFPALGSKYLAYQKDNQIFRYNLATGKKRQITSQGNNRYPTTFNGSIAYTTDRFGGTAIMIYDDINGERIVTRDGNMPSLSEDYIAFQRGTYRNYDIWAAKNNTGADANKDCNVNILDLISVRNKLNQDVHTADNWKADVNEDGRINILDLISVRNNFGKKCE